MHGRNVSRLLVMIGLLGLSGSLRAQADPPPLWQDVPLSSSPPSTPTPPSDPRLPNRPVVTPGDPWGIVDLAEITRAAGMIFSGTVTGIARNPSQETETVAVRFHVEQAIRGVTSGQEVTILEWTGAWVAGQRYRTGERVFLFLYPTSKLGLTSSVSGAIGRFRIDPGEHVCLSAQQSLAFRKDPVLGGRSRVSLSDFARAVQRAGEEE